MTSISMPKPPVVILAGFMGTGKTEVGRQLARVFDVPFVDTDERIEGRTGMSVAEFFRDRGETEFRELEKGICRDLSVDGGAVVATGGGMIVDDDNFQRLRAMGTVVLLECEPGVLVERLRSCDIRPLLGAGNDDELQRKIEALLAERLPAYHRVSRRVDTTHRTTAETAAEIAASLDGVDQEITMSIGARPLSGMTQGQSPRIVIGPGAAGRLGRHLEALGLLTRVFLVIPGHLRSLLEPKVKPSLERRAVPVQVIPIEDGDENKNLAQVRDLHDRLAAAGAERDSVLVAVGGGVTGDVGGFVAATYMRGIPFVQVPTTLLAQVDASIGGKVGVNHPRAKNLIGSIYPPHLVLSDPLVLESLPREEVANGMAEVVKTAIIGSPGLYDTLVATLERPAAEMLKDPGFLGTCVRECARVKSDVVERDLYERDLRRVLNLGHTLGHALEAAVGYESIRHGEAVGIGLIAALRVAVARGRAEESFLETTMGLLRWCGLPTRAPRVDPETLLPGLRLDKKRRSGRLHFVLPVRPGTVEIVGDVTGDELLAAL